MGYREWNRERGRLIDKDVAGTITPEEQAQLDAMQAAIDRYLERSSPRPTDVLDEIEARLSERAAN